MFTCRDERHEGERQLSMDQKGHGTKCKICKARCTRENNEKKKIEKEKALKGRFATAQEWEQFNVESVQNNPKHKHVIPHEEEFSNTEAYLEALVLEENRKVNGGHGRKSKEEYAETENKRKRDEYEELKKTEEGQQILKEKQRKDQKNKNIRKAKALESGHDWCKYGSHKVKPSDMVFCPIVDLNIKNFPVLQAGKKKRRICIHHYPMYYSTMRSFREKYRSDLSLRWRYRLEWWRQECKKKKKTISLSEDEQIHMIQSNCHYCNKASTDEEKGGIDMIIPTLRDYNSYTCVPCCKQCNMSKGSMKKDEYIQICKNITAFQEHNVENQTYIPYRRCYRDKSSGKMKSIYYTQAMSYEKYQYEASETRRNLKFTISEEDFNNIRSQGCAYCGLKNIMFIGLDQKSSRGGYTIDNINAACVTCNFIKLGYDIPKFLQKCKEVALHS